MSWVLAGCGLNLTAAGNGNLVKLGLIPYFSDACTFSYALTLRSGNWNGLGVEGSPAPSPRRVLASEVAKV